jgi:hypothetical protein
MEEVLEKSSLAALQLKRRMALSATRGVTKASMELDQFAGNIAPQTSEMMEHSVRSQQPMEEGLGIRFGVRISARGIIPI